MNYGRGPPPPYHDHSNPLVTLCCCPCMMVTSILGSCISCLCYPLLHCFGMDRHHPHHPPPPPPHHRRWLSNCGVFSNRYMYHLWVAFRPNCYVKVLNWVQQVIDVESASDNDARDQASELKTKVLVDGKQDDAKVVGVADEQNNDEPNVLEGNEVIGVGKKDGGCNSKKIMGFRNTEYFSRQHLEVRDGLE
uniref:AIG1-like protein n=1 Tax=Tanacetum cinerariifolium TaxID=118510 RepID=A0A699GXJ9_TANCI|nr:AIG1-like protein [Tanacetum cinerariifolium]